MGTTSFHNRRLEVLSVRTLFLSYVELEIASRFWDAYVKLRDEDLTDEQQKELEERCDFALAELSDPTREAFLKALDQFELEGTEFQVKIAPDDAHLVSHQKEED
ncbi:hypothetical protein HYZ64_02140 [Candidatus Berkelbacteria bacterium]|nr:hypothetical protein [Candidatus Berkelbacteria bacterium]